MTNKSASDPSPGRGSLLVIFLTVFIDLLGFGIVLPLLPIYGKQFAAEHQMSDGMVGLTVGLLMSSFSLMQMLFLSFWGRMSDRFGRRPILIIGLVGSTFFYALFGMATVWRSLTWLFVSRIGAGIAGATIATAQAYIADTTSKKNRAKGMAMIGAAFALGFTLGPLIGAVALFVGGELQLSPWPGYAASGLSATALLLAIFILPESLRPDSDHAERSLFNRSGMAAALGTPSVGLLILTTFIAVFSFANFESTLSLQIENIAVRSEQHEMKVALLEQFTRWIHAWGYEKDEDVKLIIIFAVFAYLGITLTLAQGFLVRRLATRMSEGVMATMGTALAIVGFLLLARAAATDDFHLLLVAMAVEVVGFAFVNPSLQSLISRRSDPGQQGAILGFGQSASSLARILGPAIGIPLFTGSPTWPYWMATVIMVIALILVIIASRSGRDFADEKK